MTTSRAVLVVGLAIVAVWIWQANQKADLERQAQQQQIFKDTEIKNNLGDCLSKAQTNYENKRYEVCNSKYQSYLQCVRNGESYCFNPATNVTNGFPDCGFLAPIYEDRFSTDLQNEKESCFKQFPT